MTSGSATLKIQIREPFLRRNEAGIRRLQDAGLADPDLDAGLAASMLGGMVEHFSLMWFVHGGPYDEETAIATLTRLWAQAIGLPQPSADLRFRFSSIRPNTTRASRGPPHAARGRPAGRPSRRVRL